MILTAQMLTLVALESPTSLTVGSSGTYATIADAVDYAMTEDDVYGYIIVVEEGTYTIDEDSQIVIRDLQGPLTIRADSASSNVVIDGDSLYRCIDAMSIDLTLTDLVLQNGAATTLGDDGGCAKVYEGSLVLDNVSFSDCEAADKGGGVYTYSAGPAPITGCSFTDCTADNGGGLYAKATEIVVSASSFVRCTTTASGSGDGGGLYADISSSLDDVTFQECTAGWGGAMYVGDGDCTIEDCVFHQCQSTWDSGGAIYVGNGCDTLTLDDSTFIDCTAADQGGSISCNHAELIAANCSFSGNMASDGRGGAVSCFGESASFSSCSFDQNSATSNGGALSLKCYDDTSPTTFNIVSCSFWENTSAESGGGIYISTWGAGYGGIEATIEYTTFTACDATRGGGIYANAGSDASSVELLHCTFSDNTATSASYDAAVEVAGAAMTASMASCTACDHAYGYEIDGDVIDLGDNDFGGWCCPGDVDDNWQVDADDLLSIISLTWGDTGTEDVQDDVDRDGVVDVSDLIQVLHNWGSCD